MKAIALIPARYDSTRFPGKLMVDLKGKTVIRRTYEATVATGLFEQVIVVTDSDIIYHEITSHGGTAMMSKGQHESGSDRIAEAAMEMEADVILNVQGDSPFVKKEALENLLQAFNDTSVNVGSLMRRITDETLASDPNMVKVCVDKNNNSLFFSRSLIPYPRNKTKSNSFFEHIGVYAFRKKALLDFTSWPVTPLEDIEKIECLRYLENGVRLRMVLTDHKGVEIDTVADLQRAEKLFDQ